MGDDFDSGRNTFYYSREERLKKAPQIVRDMYDPSKQIKGGLFRVFVATRPLKIMFFSMLLFFMIALFIVRMMGPGTSRVLGNNTIAVSVITAADISYITVKKTARNQKDAYTGNVSIAVTLPEDAPPLHIEWIYFSDDPEEVFQFTVPFSGQRILVLLEADGEQLLFSVRP